MKKIVFFFSLFLLSINLFSQEEVKLNNGRTIIVNSDGTWKYKQETSANKTFTDSRDGHVYKTVAIGTQTWLEENLAYKENDGCWAYNNDQNNVATYGYLYNWETAKIACSSGWHIPTKEEWKTLIDYLGGNNIAGGKMKEIGASHWNSPNTGADNSSGFTALPGGSRNNYDPTFSSIGIYGYWWSATEGLPTSASLFILNNVDKIADQDNNAKVYGFSVRCIRDY